VGGGRLAQRLAAVERQVAVGRVVIDRRAGQLQRDRRRAQVGVEVLQAQDVRVRGRVGRVADRIHADSRNVVKTCHGHGRLRS
jgi:hypothetical protein